MHESQTESEGSVTRRNFLRYGLWAIGGVIGALAGVPVIGYFISPALKEEQVPWAPIANVADIPVGMPTMVEYVQRRRDGWVTREERKAAWVLTEDSKEFTIYDPHCTHLGCAYSWKERPWSKPGPYQGQAHFHCPCHEGIFAKDGTVISGPPPRPLDRLEVKIDNDILYAGRLYQVEV